MNVHNKKQATGSFALPVEFTDAELESIYLTGYQLDRQKMHAQAHEVFSVLLLFRPRSPRYLKAAGLCLMSLRRYESAILTLSLALLLDENDPELLLACAECTSCLGGAECTRGLFQKAAELGAARGQSAIVERARAWLGAI
jgi:tetratricopeptide (TPR) repeat protein